MLPFADGQANVTLKADGLVLFSHMLLILQSVDYAKYSQKPWTDQ